MLIRIRTDIGVLRERLKNVQIPLRCRGLMKTPLGHRKFVIAVRGFAAHFYELAKQFDRLSELLVLHAEICEFQKSLGKVWAQTQRLLEQFLGSRIIPLPALDIANVEQT